MEKQKPLRLRYFDKDTKSKAIIDVKWSHLSGNTHPYLSVDIVDVKKDGVRLHDYNEKKKAIKRLNPDMGLLLDNHLVNKGLGVETHHYADAHYFYASTKKYFIAEITGQVFTKEMQTQQIADIKAKVLKGLDKILYKGVFRKDLTVCATVREYYSRVEKDLECYLYTRESRLDHMRQQVERLTNSFERHKALKAYDSWVVEYRKAKGELESLDKRQVMQPNDIWTIEKFANKYGLTEEKVKEIICKDLTQQQLADILSPIDTANTEKLMSLSDKLNIPTIKG